MAPSGPPAAKGKAKAEAKADAKAKGAPKKEKKEKEQPRPEDLIEKVAEPDYEAFQARLDKVQEAVDKLQGKQQALSKRISERSGGKDEFSGRRIELRSELDGWSSQMSGLKQKKDEIDKALGNKKEEGMNQKQELTKMKKEVGYTNEAEIDKRIGDIEHKMMHDSVPIKQEKEMLKEIQELKRNRPKVAKVNNLQAAIESDDRGLPLREQLKELREQMNSVFTQRQAVSEKLKALTEERNSKMGDLPELINERDEISKAIQEKIKERNEIKTEKKAAEDASYVYKQQIRKIKQERAVEDRVKRQAEYDERKKERRVEQVDEQPHVQEIALVEQCMFFCKSLTTVKEKKEDEEKKETVHDLPKGAEVMASKASRDEEYYYEPTARGKKGKSKAKKVEGEGKAKPIKHNAETFTLFDKIKLDAPITTDDVPALLEKLEAKLEDYQKKVKDWEEKKEDMKKRILAGEEVAPAEKEEKKEEAKEEAKEEDKEEDKEEEKEEDKEEEKEEDKEEDE